MPAPRSGSFLTDPELQAALRDLVDADGRPYGDLAESIGRKSRDSIQKALNGDPTRHQDVKRELFQLLTGKSLTNGHRVD